MEAAGVEAGGRRGKGERRTEEGRSRARQVQPEDDGARKPLLQETLSHLEILLPWLRILLPALRRSAKGSDPQQLSDAVNCSSSTTTSLQPLLVSSRTTLELLLLFSKTTLTRTTFPLYFQPKHLPSSHRFLARQRPTKPSPTSLLLLNLPLPFPHQL